MELKPCPFCGEKPHFEVKHFGTIRTFIIECEGWKDDQGYQSHPLVYASRIGFAGDKESRDTAFYSVAKKWNTRA